MKKTGLVMLTIFWGSMVFGGIVEKTFYFNNYSSAFCGDYKTVNFGNTMLAGISGEPVLPWHEVVLMLPPGESAVAIELVEEQETVVPGIWLIMPKQPPRPIAAGNPAGLIRNERVYQQREAYPAQRTGHLMTQYLNGYGFALCTFTPARYYPAAKSLTYFAKVTVKITTKKDNESLLALKNLSAGEEAYHQAQSFAMNPEMMDIYPAREAPATSYDYLIVSPVSFKNEFPPLITLYAQRGISVRVINTDSISSVMTGIDLQEKIRNFIINQRQNHSISYVLLAGNPSLIPHRKFYCFVQSGSTPYSDATIPADLYYSGLDGNYDANGNQVYAEITDNPDLLPDIAVARFTVSDTAGLHRMIRKTISYQNNPVLGEFNKPLLAGEYLYDDPITFGSDYMNLLINNHSDNGYYTHGIPSATNQIGTLYDTLTSASPLTYWSWSATQLLARINQGNSFIHHLGHANSTYMMRMSMSAITNANFAQVNGIIHNFQILYTQGCDDGAFDVSGGCIAGKAVSIDNFLVAGIFNSRYGWFNQGTTDGPSQHLQREFISAIYNDTLPEKHIATAHMISKIKTAPWISLPGEFEPGAQRWVHYDCNVFGDPALRIRTEEPTSFTQITWTGTIDSDWNKAGNWNLARVPTSICDVTIAAGSHNPVINTTGATWCHNLTIQNGANLTINPGKSMIVYGTVMMDGE